MAKFSLTQNQREGLVLLKIGTFLEYFDLMLFIHMIPTLNKVFFPTDNVEQQDFFAAFAYASSYIVRPVGALLFGYIGDKYGRKSTVIITTMMMAFACLVIAYCPPYAQIGIAASWIITVCRILQGFSSLGEMVGAQIYVTETIEKPYVHWAVSGIWVANCLGIFFAMVVVFISTLYTFSYQFGFLFGATIAVVGSFARTIMRETPDFLEHNVSRELFLKTKEYIINKKDLAAIFCCLMGLHVSFYIIFLYFNPILTNQYQYTLNDIAARNLILSFIWIIPYWLLGKLSLRMNIFPIVRIRTVICLCVMVVLPFIINIISDIDNGDTYIFVVQVVLIACAMVASPLESSYIKLLPVLKRFRAVGLVFSFSIGLSVLLSSFGLVYLTKAFGYFGILLITVPVNLLVLYGIVYFEKKDREEDRSVPLSYGGVN